jgi:hypothetical protein
MEINEASIGHSGPNSIYRSSRRQQRIRTNMSPISLRILTEVASCECAQVIARCSCERDRLCEKSVPKRWHEHPAREDKS